MKKKYLTNLENKYYYGISRTFWHIFTITAILGFLTAIIIVGWSYLPPSKKEVLKAPTPVKEAYPSQTSIELSEILDALPKDKTKIEQIKNISAENTPKNEIDNKKIKRDTVGLKAYERQIANLKNLLPFKDFPRLWNGEGYYTYPRGEALYKIKKLESFRKFITTSPGLLKKLETRTDNNGFKSYQEKASLVEQYNQILELLGKKDRIDIINSLTYFKNRDFNKTLNSLKALQKVIQLYPKDEIIKGFERHSRFLRSNPNDGIGLLEFESEFLENFSKSERYSASNIIEFEYVNYYNNNLGGIKENTINFTPFLKEIDTVKQSIALSYYYEIYKEKNVDRRKKIQIIDNEYNSKLEKIETDFMASKIEAETEYQGKKANKSIWRGTSLKAIGFTLGAILLITIILLLLSMIRNVNKLAQAMLENNKKSNS